MNLVLEDQCGRVVSSANPEAGAVSDIMRQDDTRCTMGERTRTAIETQHSWAHRAQQTDLVLERAVSRRKGGDKSYMPTKNE